MPTFEGSCHCGQTAWTAEIPEATHILCHCSACKVLGGGEFTLNQIIPKDNLKVTKGTLSKYVYKGDSGKSVECFFCPTCTSHAYHHQEVMGPDTIVVRTALLKGSDKWGKPAAEIFGKEKWSWQPQTASDIFETTPPS